MAPSDGAFFEAFFTWVYTPRAHADGSVDQIVEESLTFPHQQSVEAFQAQVDVCLTHDTVDRLSQIAAPTLVLSGELDVIAPPRIGRSVAEAIPNARFELMPGEAHQPFQEAPDEFNAAGRRVLARGRRRRVIRPASSVHSRLTAEDVDVWPGPPFPALVPHSILGGCYGCVVAPGRFESELSRPSDRSERPAAPFLRVSPPSVGRTT